jgi:hypothetical protein
METNFSFHAFERVLGRISMTHRELASLLDDDLAINIGEEKNSNRVHKLFYSERDKICLVAIQDIKTGTVVTVLPIDYHENISWAVSLESQLQAKNLIIEEEATPNKESEILHTNASVFRISGNIIDEYGRYIKNVNLGSWPCEPYEYSIDALVEDKEFVKALIKKLTEKISDSENTTRIIQTVAIRLGNRGDPIFFSTSDIITISA